MRAIDIDVAGKPAELTGRRPEELVDAKSNRRMRYVEFEGLVCVSGVNYYCNN